MVADNNATSSLSTVAMGGEDNIRRRLRLNGYNVFVKRCSLENRAKPFGNIREFLDYAIEEDVFERKRVHRKKNVGLNGESSFAGCASTPILSFIKVTSKAYKKLSDEEKQAYREIAYYIRIPKCLRQEEAYNALVDMIRIAEDDK